MILTVDDFGFHGPANSLVKRAIAAGLPTHVGTMVTMPGSTEAFELLTSSPFQTVKRGLHFNISESVPVSDPATVPTLVNRDGQFYSWDNVFRRSVLGQINPAEVAREAEAQLALLGRHAPIDFFNSHHHVHLWPPIAHMLAPVIRRAAIPFVRHPQAIWWWALTERYGFKGILVEAVSQLHAPATKRMSTAFVDFDWIDPSDVARFAALRKVPKSAELACHPHRYTTSADPAAIDPPSSLEWLVTHKDEVIKNSKTH